MNIYYEWESKFPFLGFKPLISSKICPKRIRVQSSLIVSKNVILNINPFTNKRLFEICTLFNLLTSNEFRVINYCSHSLVVFKRENTKQRLERTLVYFFEFLIRLQNVCVRTAIIMFLIYEAQIHHRKCKLVNTTDWHGVRVTSPKLSLKTKNVCHLNTFYPKIIVN